MPIPVPVRVALALPVLLASCRDAPPSEEPIAPAPPVVDVTAVDYALQAPDSIPSGWVTFRLANQGQEPHFVLLTRLPDSVEFARYWNEVGPPFGAAWEGLQSGRLDKPAAGALLADQLPGWYLADAIPSGGPGMLSPGGASEVTVHLAPGTYMMECYVKTAEGRFHVDLGMFRKLVVRPDSSEASLDQPTVTVTVTDAAISAPARLPAGRHLVAVQFASQPAIPPAHDVHVARLAEGQDPATVAAWMDWMEIDGLAAPGPATFVGGAQDGPAGTTAYMRLDLPPGRYLWVAEAPIERGLFHEFVVE